MKMDMSAKPQGEEYPKSNEGEYTQEHLECMLKNYIEAKKIDADPALLATLKDYAMSKNKMVEDMFKGKPVKSLKELKSRREGLNNKNPSVEIEISSESDDMEGEDE